MISVSSNLEGFDRMNNSISLNEVVFSKVLKRDLDGDSKWAKITYDYDRDVILFDDECLNKDAYKRYVSSVADGDVEMIMVGASMMSTPAYSVQIVLLEGKDAIEINEKRYEFNQEESEKSKDITNSIKVTGGSKVISPTCFLNTTDQ
jgi:hypothetical protein